MPVVLLPSTPLTARTALLLIEDALALGNAVGVDQTLTSRESDDCLRTLNDLIEDWNTQDLAVYGQGNQTFNTVAGQAVYTVGPAGNWNTNRPVRINQPAYTTYNDVSFPCVPIGQDYYNQIPVKSQDQEYADFYLYVNEYPLGVITLWPVPSMALPITFSIDFQISGAPTVATVLQFPPGYMKAFRYALAVELAPVFGRMASDTVRLEASKCFGNIKRANTKMREMRFDPAITFSGPRTWQVFP